jgi:hypothetical protein
MKFRPLPTPNFLSGGKVRQPEVSLGICSDQLVHLADDCHHALANRPKPVYSNSQAHFFFVA